MTRSWFQWVASVGVTVALTASPVAIAELAPIGYHHAGREASLGGSGGQAAAVPLDFPRERQGLPIPVSIIEGGTRMGAAGRGWDVPLSYVAKNTSLAHVRPDASGLFPAAATYTLSLLGRAVELVPKTGEPVPGKWVARAGWPDMIAVQESAGIWKVYDGNGRTYTFENDTNQPSPGIYTLLKRVEGSASSRVELKYEIAKRDLLRTPNAPAQVGYKDALSIDLVEVTYNFDANDVPKHRVSLVYGPENTHPYNPQIRLPLSLGVAESTDAGGAIYNYVRLRKLEHLDVSSRMTASAPFQRLSRYQLSYTEDPDTGLPQLTKVAISGQQGTSEENSSLTLANYQYGRATVPGVPINSGTEDQWPAFQLKYNRTQVITPPAGMPAAALAGTVKAFAGDFRNAQQLIDVTGDGRVDWVFPSSDGNVPLKVARQTPDSSGKPVFSGGMTGPLSDGVMTSASLGQHKTQKVDAEGEHENTITDTWRQFVDVNGDGRPDLIRADEVPKKWVVYLNTPASSAAYNTTWVRQEHKIDHLAAALASRGHSEFSASSYFLPLMRQRTGIDYRDAICWRYDEDEDGWHEVTSEHAIWHDPGNGLPGEWIYPVCGQAPRRAQSIGEVTGTDWKLLDVNADGGLDFVMGRSALRTVRYAPEPTSSANDGSEQPGSAHYSLVSDAAIDVVYGLSSAQPIPGSAVVPLGSGAGVGVETWRVDYNQTMTCNEFGESCHWMQALSGQYNIMSLKDVNGDGLADLNLYLRSAEIFGRSYLGTGSGFSRAYIDIGEPEVYLNSREDDCKSGSTFVASSRRGFADLTGDGIPDKVYHRQNDGMVVEIGTGAGFRNPIRITSPKFSVSATKNSCNDDVANTVAGLYDFDGDGKQDYVARDQNGNLELYQLEGRSIGAVPDQRALSAGLLTQIGNDHGASTSYQYKSAKDDGTTPHQIPQAEIVIGKVTTFQTSTQQQAETRYAYGTPIFAFDLMSGSYRSFGYGRTIAVTSSTGTMPSGGGSIEGNAVVTDAWTQTGSSTDSHQSLFTTYLRAGRPREITTLSGIVTDPWVMLTTNLSTDARRSSGQSFTYDARSWNGAADGGVCPAAYPMCRVYGFMYTRMEGSWQGKGGGGAPPATTNLMTESKVMAIDEYGRVTSRYLGNDSRRNDDNQCLQTTFASPSSGNLPRVMTAVASTELRKATADGLCTGAGTYAVASARMLYDDLPQGKVKLGLPTAKLVDRRDGAQLLETIRSFDIEYDAYDNPSVVTSQSGDGRTRSVSTIYDAFGLVPETSTLTATDAETTTSKVERDQLTLLPLKVTDPNNLEHGTRYDGFQRPILTTVKPQDGATGSLAFIAYENFEVPFAKRKVITKNFDNLVVPATVVAAQAATGRITTTELDDAGRPTRTLIDLGADYPDDLVIGEMRFDALGRTSFVADPHPAGESPDTAYGTTYHYFTEGGLMCAIRGFGPMARPTNLLAASDGNVERFATCYSNEYENGQLVAGAWLPDATHEFPGERIKRVATMDAMGRVLSRETLRQTVTPAQRLEYSTFGYDEMGNVARTTRFRSPGASVPSEPVEWNFRYDSLGQMLEHLEPNGGNSQTSRISTYSHWGEVLSQSSAASSLGGSSAPPQREAMKYDGLSRLVRRWQERGGEALRETEVTYSYDHSTGAHPALGTSSMLGRLASAVSPTESIHYGYDVFGRVKTIAHESEDHTFYVSTSSYDADGTLTEMGALLPDTGYKREYMKYTYDSARNLQSASFVDEQGVSRLLYQVAQTDMLGRLRAAKVGGADYLVDYADNGRRLFEKMTLSTDDGQLREITNQGYDPLGREIARVETVNTASLYTQYGYDPLGRLSGSASLVPGDPNRTIVKRSQLTYDPLGNLLLNDDVLSNDDVSLSYAGSNLDRLCSIGYNGTAASTTQCNVVHDSFGNIVQQPTVTGQRQFTYLPSGAVNTIAQSGASAAYAYGPFGDVQKLTITGSGIEPRQDRRYGQFELRSVQGQDVLERNVPIGDFSATRKGATGNWILALGEPRGNRYFVDQEGKLQQQVDYKDFGDPASQGAPVNSSTYSRAQWNGGDRLAGFGMSHLGARLYDPKIGRFLSADPLVLMRTAATSNPYAFAENDPVNNSDPLGLECAEGGCVEKSYGSGANGFPVSGSFSVAPAASSGPTSPPRAAPPAPPAPPSVLPSTVPFSVQREKWAAPPQFKIPMLEEEGDSDSSRCYKGRCIGSLGTSSDFPGRHPVQLDGTPEKWEQAKVQGAGALIAAGVWVGGAQMLGMKGAVEGGLVALRVSPGTAGLLATPISSGVIAAEINVGTTLAAGKEVRLRSVAFAAAAGALGGSVGKALMGRGGVFAWTPGDPLSYNVGKFIAAQGAFIPMSLGIGMASSAVNGGSMDGEMNGQMVNYVGTSGRAFVFNIVGAYVPGLAPGTAGNQIVNGLVLSPVQANVIQKLHPDWTPK